MTTPADARQASQDRHVTLHRGGGAVVFGRRGGEPFGQPIEPVFGFLDLPVHEPEALDDDLQVGGGGVDGAGGGSDRGLAQAVEHVVSVEAADAIALQQAFDRRRPHARRLGGRRDVFPEVEEPGGGDVVVELEHGWEVAPEQLAHAVGEAIAIVTQVLKQTRALAQFDDARIERLQAPEAAQIGAHRIGEDERVAAVVLGAGGREAVAEAIELLRIDGVDTEATRHEGLDDRTVRRLDGDLDGAGLGLGGGEDPGRQGGEALATVARSCARPACAPWHRR